MPVPRICSQILQMVANERKNVQVQSVNWESKKLNKEINLPGINTLQLVHQIQSLERLQKNIVNYVQQSIHKDIPECLAWTKTMGNPVIVPDDLQKTYLEHVQIWQQIHGDMDLLEAAWGVYKNTPEFDPEFSGYLASLWNPVCTQYEKEILCNFLQLNRENKQYTLNHLEKDMTNYKKNELTHQLLITARNTHIPDESLFKENVLQAGFQQLSSVQDWKSAKEIIQNLVKKDNESHLLAEILCRVENFCNTQTYDTSILEGHVSNFITHCTQFIETIPKFLVSPSLAYNTQQTWGVPHLSLEFNDGVLSLCNAPLQVIHPEKQDSKMFLPASTLFLELGEVMLSPEITALTQNAKDITRFIKLRVNTTPKNNTVNIELLKQVDKENLRECIQHIQGKLIHGSSYFKLAKPLSMVAWKIDLPKKQLISTRGIKQNHNFAEPHQIPRTVNKENTDLKSVGGIHIVQSNADNSARNTVCQTIQSVFSNLDIPVTKDHPMYGVLCETVACFTLHDPVLHTLISLHASIPWTHKYQDTRYAETQVGNNGSSRYRDWCNFVTGKLNARQKSKLDSHVVSYNGIHQTYVPWLHGDAGHTWVNVGSTLPMASFVLPSQKNKCSLENLQEIIQEQLNNKKLVLPSRSDMTQEIHTFTDEATQTLMMVYGSPQDPDKNLDFVAFQMCS